MQQHTCSQIHRHGCSNTEELNQLKLLAYVRCPNTKTKPNKNVKFIFFLYFSANEKCNRTSSIAYDAYTHKLHDTDTWYISIAVYLFVGWYVCEITFFVYYSVCVLVLNLAERLLPHNNNYWQNKPSMFCILDTDARQKKQKTPKKIASTLVFICQWISKCVLIKIWTHGGIQKDEKIK